MIRIHVELEAPGVTEVIVGVSSGLLAWQIATYGSGYTYTISHRALLPHDVRTGYSPSLIGTVLDMRRAIKRLYRHRHA